MLYYIYILHSSGISSQTTYTDRLGGSATAFMVVTEGHRGKQLIPNLLSTPTIHSPGIRTIKHNS